MFFFDEIVKEHVFKPISLESAYLAILDNDLKTAEGIFEAQDSPRALWGRSFVEILRGFLERYPTYFEIRNFMEIDLDFLVKNEKNDYVEQFLGSLDYLSNINREVYKYAARVMFINKLYNSAYRYLEKSKNIFYNDPELQFMLAKYYLNIGDYKMSDFHISECLKIIPTYVPAIKMKEQLSGKLF